VLAVVLAGCATTSGGKASKAGPEVRAIERWNLLIARDAAKAYDYLSPGTRQTEQRDAYAQKMNSRPIRWEKVLLYSKTCATEDSCRIALQLDINVPLPGVGNAPSVAFTQENWIRHTDGGWYYLGPVGKDAN
jgi:hypothetical protein